MGSNTNNIAGRLMGDLIRDFGLTRSQALGFVGNLAHESSGFKTLQEVSPVVKGSRGGYGYAQWTGPRRRQFEAWSRKRGLKTNSYKANYGFLKHELNTTERKALSAIRRAKNSHAAARISSKRFFRPGKVNMKSRLNWTNKFAGIRGQQPIAPPIDFASLPKRGPGVGSKASPGPSGPALAYAGAAPSASGLAAIEGAIRPNGPRNLDHRQPVGIASRAPAALASAGPRLAQAASPMSLAPVTPRSLQAVPAQPMQAVQPRSINATQPRAKMARPEYNFRLDLNKSPLSAAPASLPRSRPALDMQAGVPLDSAAGYRDRLKQSYVDRAASHPAAIGGLPKANAYPDRLKQSYLDRVPSVPAPIAGLPKANGYMDRVKQSYAAPRGAPAAGPAVNMPTPLTGLPRAKPGVGSVSVAKAANAVSDVPAKGAPELMDAKAPQSFTVNRANKQNKGGTWMDRTLGMGSGRNFQRGMMGGALLGVNPLVGGAIGLAAPHIMDMVAPNFKGFGSMFGDALDEGFNFDGGFAGPSGHNYAEGTAIGNGVAVMMNSGNPGDFWDYNTNVDNPMADMVFGNEQAAMQGKSTKSLGEKLSEDFGKLFG